MVEKRPLQAELDLANEIEKLIAARTEYEVRDRDLVGIQEHVIETIRKSNRCAVEELLKLT
jgi:hypothetical protein